MSTLARAGQVDHRSAAPELSHTEPPATVDQERIWEIDGYPTNRWFGIGALALAIAGIGIVTTQPAVVLLAAMGAWYALYGRLVRQPEATVQLTREIDDPTGSPGDHLRVTVQLENVGDRALPDVRVADGVPDTLTVVEGTPRHATALAPGAQDQFSYVIEARRGYHGFDEATVILRDLAGANEHVYAAEVPSEVHVQPDPDPMPPLPLRELTRMVTGRVETRHGGEGVEFHSTREYRAGDPRSQIDWNRMARTGELTTVEYRQERAATVVVIVDVRPEAFVAMPNRAPPAANAGLDAAVSVFFALLDAGDRVGVATLGPDPVWIPPRLGSDHRAMARLLFGSHPAFGPAPPTDRVPANRARRSLLRRLPAEAQVVFLSPLADGSAERFAVGLESRGHPVTILSPDPSGSATDGQLLAALERHLRVARLRERGIRVIEWDDDRSLMAAIEGGQRRW